jgi:hypothetical protein
MLFEQSGQQAESSAPAPSAEPAASEAAAPADDGSAETMASAPVESDEDVAVTDGVDAAGGTEGPPADRSADTDTSDDER